MADVPAHPTADDELRAVLVAFVDCVVQRLAAMPDRHDLPERLCTAEELGEWMQIPPSTLLEYARDHKIPSVRLGKHVRFDPRAVIRALE